MSSQFGIYATSADMLEVGQLIEALSEPFIIFDSLRTTSAPRIVSNLASPKCVSLRIARESDFGDVRWSMLPNGHEYVDDFSSPVIEVFTPYFDGNEMSQGRFYHLRTYFDEEGRKVSKSEEFLTWAKSVFRVVKRGLSFDKTLRLPAYVGAEAKSWLSEHKGFQVTANGRIIA